MSRLLTSVGAKRLSQPLIQGPIRHYMPGTVKARQLKYWLNNEKPKKVPITERLPGPKYLIKQLDEEEKQRILREYPREIESFRAGDKIEITKSISLMSEKLEKVRGFVTERRGGKSVKASFIIINVKMGMPYEIQYPLYSPFIKKITVIEHGGKTGAKMRWMKDRPEMEYEC